MKVAAYIRVSTQKQADKGSSLEAQEAKLRSYCELYEHDLIGIYSDPGSSAKDLKRPGVQAALGALETGEAEALLVVKLDRLTRSTRDLGSLIEQYFGEGKWTLLSVGEHLDTASASGRLVINILMSVFQWERESVGERTRAVKTFQKSQGRYLGGAVPFGYQVGRDKKLEENKDEMAVIAEIVHLREGGLSHGVAAQWLNDKGLRTRSGNLWSAANVWNVAKQAGLNGQQKTEG